MSRFGRLLRSATAAALTAVGASDAVAQQTPAAPAALPDVTDFLTTNQVTAASGFGRSGRADCAPPCAPGCQPAPCTPYYQGAPGTPTTQTPIPLTQSPTTGEAVAMDTPEFGGRGRGAGAGPTVGLNGYIENAAPVSVFRLRGDFGYNMNRPDRAGYFYSKCGCFGTPDAKGPPLPETNIDYQELTPYLEVALCERFSVFADIPIRFINPTNNRNASGLSDINFGTKWAFIYNEKRIVSFLLRATAPSGETDLGLGQENWRLEPGVLWLEQLNPKWQVFGEIRNSIPLSKQSDFVGNVMRYGIGTSYMVASGRSWYVAPVVEAVGWTVLDGKELDLSRGAIDSAGKTIVNGKFGVRIGFGDVTPGNPYPSRSDIYIGYGRSITGDRWYSDLLRLEYRFFF